MVKFLEHYTNYAKHIPEYNQWKNDAVSNKKAGQPVDIELQKKAKAIAEPVLLFDKYERERAEDAETFYQTLNMEIIPITGLISSLPIAVSKLPQFLKKYADKSNALKKLSQQLTTYANKTIKLGKKNIGLPKALTTLSALLAGVFYVASMNNSTVSQQGMIRKAGFDSSQEQIKDPELFAILTKEQEAQTDKIVEENQKKGNDFVDKLKDKVNITSSFQAVGDYHKNLSDYKKKKQAYFAEQENKVQNNNIKLSSSEIEEAQQDKELFQNFIKTVEHDSLIPLKRVETISNISYSALFLGGFLEYLISDKMIDMLHIKNKPLKMVAKLGIPILTYMLLNKNISDLENKAILATKFKHLKHFVEDPTGQTPLEDTTKQSLPKFVKTVIKDMKDYNEFTSKELPKIEAKLNAKRKIKLSDEQLKEAQKLQKNTSMVLNKHRETLYNHTVGIETLSETLLGPIDFLTTAAGGILGHKLAKAANKPHLAGLFAGIGAIITFIPAAMSEAFFTKQQKTAEKVSAMLAIKDIDNARNFADLNKQPYNYIVDSKRPKVFDDIKQA